MMRAINWIVMSGALSDMVNTNIYLVTTFEELERYRCYLDGIEYMQKIIRNVNGSLMSLYDYSEDEFSCTLGRNICILTKGK